MLFPHPDPRYVIVWAAAGQDGQALFALEMGDKGLLVAALADLVDTRPPGFDAEGKSFLVVHAGDEIRRYSFPSGDIIGRLLWSDETDPLAETVEFSGKNLALVSTNDGRMHLVDVAAFRLIDEVSVSGHEPRPVPELYPVLAGETGLASDMSYFRPYAEGSLVSVHRQLPSRNGEPGDEVIVWQLPEQ